MTTTRRRATLFKRWPEARAIYRTINAEAESLIGLYQAECARPAARCAGVEDLELATLSWVRLFNHNRLHSSIGYLTPVEHETAHYRHNPVPQQPLGELSLH